MFAFYSVKVLRRFLYFRLKMTILNQLPVWFVGEHLCLLWLRQMWENQLKKLLMYWFFQWACKSYNGSSLYAFLHIMLPIKVIYSNYIFVAFYLNDLYWEEFWILNCVYLRSSQNPTYMIYINLVLVCNFCGKVDFMYVLLLEFVIPCR